MNYVLKSILDTDKKARLKKSEAMKYSNDIFNSIYKEKDTLLESELKAARKKIDFINDRIEKSAEKKLESVKQQNNRLLSELEKKQQENISKWITQLYERCIRSD